ncbi:lipase ABHD2 [Seminavis robusta]|uniref:Lipase ABHD2 n=1 Tax=Seminavis robusta TaxID=568900 RepID=A0A9N8DZB9_9STRA|nr:lipase ABHD2 [Seminavis robusta]|eukprot:Sro492_g153780.1 lipase ABHD2 (569) ;mRNA; f:16367-18073
MVISNTDHQETPTSRKDDSEAEGKTLLLASSGGQDNCSLKHSPSSQLEAAATSARNLIRRTSSVVWDERPKTPAGWSILLAAMASMLVGYELQLQQQLTCPPLVFLQDDDHENNPPSLIHLIYRHLTRHSDSILSQNITPSLWVGTRSLLATSLAVVTGIPNHSDHHLRLQEIVTMPMDGAQIALYWEAPLVEPPNNTNTKQQQAPSRIIITRETLLQGPIDKPLVLILHGLNNNSSCGYIRSLQRIISNRGHIAVAMNFRGCQCPLTSPRGYNGAYTGDLRSVVHMIVGRLHSASVPLFLVGHSLGGNIITKYLGEEGLSGTLHPSIVAGASLANPLDIHSRNNVHTPWKQLMAWGAKMDILSKWKTFQQLTGYPEVRKALWGIVKATTMDQFDEAVFPLLLRNDPYYPFGIHIGYESVEEYWKDCSSYRFVKHITVPLLQIIAGDDPVVYHCFQRKLTHSIRNPNVMSVETKCGGHLGWQESPPPQSQNNSDNDNGDRPSWAGRATADFIDAVLEIRKTQASSGPVQWSSSEHIINKNNHDRQAENNSVGSTRTDHSDAPLLRSRL